MTTPSARQLVQPDELDTETKAQCSRIAERVGTPAYVYLRSVLLSRLADFARAVGFLQSVAVHCHYALLANDNPHLVVELLQGLARSGNTPGVLCASTAHLRLISELPGLPPGCSVAYSDPALATSNWMSIFSGALRRPEISQLYLILTTAGQVERLIESLQARRGSTVGAESKGAVEVGLRVKLLANEQEADRGSGVPGDVYSLYHGPAARFGIPASQELVAALEKLRRAGFSRVGFHMYPGTNLCCVALLRNLYQRFAEAVKEAVRRVGVELAFLDLGGGFGIDYATGCTIDLAELAALWQDTFASLTTGRETILIEPGRTIIGPAGLLITRVLDREERGGVQHLIVDAGMSHFARPYIYGVAHRIATLNEQSRDATKMRTVVSGCTMASGDFFTGHPLAGAEVRLPRVQVGDLLAVLDVGAYGFSMSSRFSGQLRPPEVLALEDGSNLLIRAREPVAALKAEVPECPELL